VLALGSKAHQRVASSVAGALEVLAAGCQLDGTVGGGLALMLVDANLLLYASLEDFPQLAAARDWLDTQLNGPRRVGLPWPALLAFTRITTNARLFTSPLSTKAAWGQVRR
jgi:hypothetical protein